MENKSKIPDELMPPKEMYEMAKKIDAEYYITAYEMLLEINKGISPTDAIDMLSEMTAHKIALQIGSGLTGYDIRILKGVIERHIAGLIRLE